jgi:hypothetical protein
MYDKAILGELATFEDRSYHMLNLTMDVIIMNIDQLRRLVNKGESVSHLKLKGIVTTRGQDRLTKCLLINK